MCKVGDIVIVENFKNELGEDVERHPFIIIGDKKGTVLGNETDRVGVLLNSFRNRYHRDKKLKFPANMEVRKKDGAVKGSYAKTNYLFCFDSNNTEMIKVGSVNKEFLRSLRKNIAKNLQDNKIIVITSNIEFDKYYELEDEYELGM